MSDGPDAFLYHITGEAFEDETPGHVGVAVSGGGDSMALLLLMEHWAAESGATISAVTVDHGLRPEAAEEAAMVAALCAERGIPHDTLKWQGWDGTGNLQAEARAARYRLIAEWAKARGVEAVCLGHTKDDQAETFLMRLARKAGSDGLRGMPQQFEREGMRWVRPLLDVRREALRDFLRRRGVGWVEDPSNEDTRFDRVKARRALAALEPLGIGADELSAVAANLSNENALIRQVVRERLNGLAEARCGAVSMPREAYGNLPFEVRRRFLRAAAGWIAGGDYAIRDAAMADLAAALDAGGTHVAGGMIGFASKGRIWLAREYQAVKDMRGNPFDGRWRIEGPLEGCEIRALGEEGLRQLPDWRETGLPRRALLPLPGVWQGETLVSAPHLQAESRYKASRLRPAFDKWIMQH